VVSINFLIFIYQKYDPYVYFMEIF